MKAGVLTTANLTRACLRMGCEVASALEPGRRGSHTPGQRF